ncbi:uncharacterized protein slow isoform X2 [Fopius arisanus]|uniref:Uncharacterized protein slow isoform X2 n=1 Tax=Fopius arisanus TaxID=64838 RepID=A0A9R1TP02_9HYME|nr:PREDICTED: uncharacterized protein LOC105272354 isoform X2 [Fopius arisanus]
MTITRLTGLVSLLILMTSRRPVDATELQFSRNSTRTHHHSHHLHRHHLHSDSVDKSVDTDRRGRIHRSRELDDSSVDDTRTPSPHQEDRPGRLTAVDSTRTGYQGDQRFRAREGFNGFSLTTSPPVYTKHHPGRRVCTRQPPAGNHAGTQIRFTYTQLSTPGFLCCPGWTQVTPTSYGCNRPTCIAPCYNGGICGTHGKCNCPKGFTGTQCQIDVDECITEKPCAQICTNIPGSYECHCRYGFHLQPDGQSCRKNDSDGTALEARDLENDYGITTTTRTDGKPHDTENEVGDGEDENFHGIIRRLNKLEKFAREKRRETETIQLNTKIDQAVEGVAELRLAAKNALHFLLETFGPVRQDMTNLKSKFELEHRRVDYLIQRVADLDHRLNGQRPGIMNG